MLSINTNHSSLIAQNSMKTSTDKLNQAIERMTTGFKINHASDNAANYSISTNMTTQLSAYDIAADNVAMGMDLVSYASDIISQMQDKAARLNALSTQARNGTYGAQSLSALNSEASAIMSEIMRLYSTAEYNDISLFNRTAYTIAPHLPQAGESGFIDETAFIAVASDNGEYGDFLVDPKHPNGDAYVDGLTSVTEALATTGLTNGGEYKVGGVEDLKALATYVNSGNDTSGMTFIMSKDIDLSGEANWTPIGNRSASSSYIFRGTFDGNGHVIKNLKIDRETSDYQGLFGRVSSGEIKNVGLENVNVKGKNDVGGLVGIATGTISNCYATGNVEGDHEVGGLAGNGYVYTTIMNSYTTTNVFGSGSDVGGLVGDATFTTLDNCYATGNVTGNNNVGGLAGNTSKVTNCYATGNVTGNNNVGGLVAHANDILNCYATGNVEGNDGVGGLCNIGQNIINCYATGNVEGNDGVGGLCNIGQNIINCYATGNVTGNNNVGGLVGNVINLVSRSYATGQVIGNNNVGGLVGYIEYYDSDVTIEYSNSYSNVIGLSTTGSFIGGIIGTKIWEYKLDDGEGNIDEGVDTIVDGELLLTNCSAIASDKSYVGGYYKLFVFDMDYEDPATGDYIYEYTQEYELDTTFDLSVYNTNITAVELRNIMTNLQVGIYNNSSSQINFDTNFSFDLNLDSGIESVEAFDAIVAFENLLSEKATQLGAIQNRLNSALESIEVNINNLTSSRSTIRDADIAEVSSHYIQQQILQQASATLMATANQAPSIALQLI